MKKAFDPFDERHRNKQRRRSSAEVSYDKRTWNDRVDKHFRNVLETLEWPDYVSSEQITAMLFMDEMTVPYDALRRNFPAAMERLEYSKLANPKTKDGRWKIGGMFIFAYHKKNSPTLERSELKQALGL